MTNSWGTSPAKSVRSAPNRATGPATRALPNIKLVLLPDRHGDFDYAVNVGRRRVSRPDGYRNPYLSAILERDLLRLFDGSNRTAPERRFLDWLGSTESDTPVEIITEQPPRSPWRWRPRSRPGPTLLLQNEGRQNIVAIPAIESGDKKTTVLKPPFIVLGRHLVYSQGSERLAVLESECPWFIVSDAARYAAFDSAIEVAYGGGGDGFPAFGGSDFAPAYFNQIGIQLGATSVRNWSVDRKALRLFHDETAVTEIPDVPLQRNISARPGSPGERLNLVPEITVEGIPQLWIHTCAQMLEPLRWDHPGSLFSAKKRSLGLERGVWRILAAGCRPEARSAALEAAMENPALQHDRWGSSCRDYLENVLKLVASWDATVLQTSSHESLPPFLTFSQAEVKGLEALGLIGWHLTKDAEDPPKLVIGKDTVAFTAPESTVANALPDLKNDCDERTIELRVDGGPIETVSLQIDIVADAIQEYDGSDLRPIDFFELHPEVCCDGFEIPAGRWKQLITGGLLQPPAGSELPFASSTKPPASSSPASASTHRPTGSEEPPPPIPRLQIFDWLDLVKQGANLRLPPGEQAIIDSLRSGELDHRAALPTRLLAEMRPYQEAGYEWLAYLYRHRFGGISPTTWASEKPSRPSHSSPD